MVIAQVGVDGASDFFRVAVRSATTGVAVDNVAAAEVAVRLLVRIEERRDLRDREPVREWGVATQGVHPASLRRLASRDEGAQAVARHLHAGVGSRLVDDFVAVAAMERLVALVDLGGLAVAGDTLVVDGGKMSAN